MPELQPGCYELRRSDWLMKNPFALKIDYSSRVYGLDVFRAVAIIFVVIGHGGFMIDEALPGFPWIRLIDGVELFFVLSGFLIGNILIRMYEKKGTISARDLFGFWKRRWFRTVPNYYLILLVNIALVTAGVINGNKESISWEFFFFLQNITSPFTDFFWESWSLTVEEWFYILFPLLMLGIISISGKSIPKQNKVLATIIIFILCPLLYRISVSSEQVDLFWYDTKFRKLVATRLDAIMYGVLFAWLRIYYNRIFEKIALPAFVSGIVLIYAFMYLQAQDSTGYFAKTFYFSLTGFSASLLLPWASMKQKCTTRFGRMMTFISVISYSMYLLNFGPIAQVIQYNFNPEGPLQGIIAYLIFWITVVGTSTLLYKYFEKPVMDLREK